MQSFRTLTLEMLYQKESKGKKELRENQMIHNFSIAAGH